jgi:chloramphenicol 3-O-phosphotransferase
VETSTVSSSGAVPILIVTGAPGAGKTVLAEALLERESRALVFDADWLLAPTSDLVGRDMAEARDLWPSYDRLWAAILGMVARNHRAAVLLTPMDPGSPPPIPGTVDVSWCLLDCDDATRTARLAGRGWPNDEIAGALADAAALRLQIAFVIDTGVTTPVEAAALVAERMRAQPDHRS